MSAAKHTPGPWYVDAVEIAGTCGRFEVNDSTCHVPTTEANARLLAAAPDLLAALRNLVEAVDALKDKAAQP